MWIRRRRKLEWLAPVLFTLDLCLRMAGRAEAQEGFLSIDCGSVTSYVDNVTGIRWVTDDDYISTGQNSNQVSKESTSDNATQLLDLRFFPEDSKRNCYILPVDPDATYLVRSIFAYLDFGSTSNSVSFDLFVNATFWTTVTYALTPGSTPTTQTSEMFFRSNGTVLSICLVGKDAFISSLELRKLDDSMYKMVQNGVILVGFGARYNFGVNSSTAGVNESLRYPDDKYDRIWISLGPSAEHPEECPAIISNSTELNSTYVDGNRPPSEVMQTACISVNSNITLAIQFPTNVDQYYAALYLQELNASASDSDPRGLLVDTYGGVPAAAHNVTASEEQLDETEDLLSNEFKVTIARLSSSTLGPLVNGAEFLVRKTVNTSHTDNVDVNALDAVRQSFNPTNCSGDPCFPVSCDWLTCDYSTLPSRVTQVNLTGMGIRGIIPSALAELTQLADLRLDNNNFQGTIPDFRNLTKLERLHLENNSLSGAFPGYFFEVGNLSELFVEDNNLTGSIPKCPEQSILSYRCDENPSLQCPTGIQTCVKSSSGSSKHRVIIIVFACFGGMLLVIIIGVLSYLQCNRKRRQLVPPGERRALRNKANKFRSGEQSDLQSSISLDEIVQATENFEKKIGEGSFGSVYYGKLSNGQEVAVKTNADASRQGTAEFVNEVNLLSRVHHKNLVSLLGFCNEAEELLLVYAYMSNGTLREHLYGAGRNCLDWITRLDIAVNSAKGLEYLHTACSPRIIHRDVKTSNILLDDKFVAKVADFGLSKSALDLKSASGFYTNIKGTPGYFDPELFVAEKLTQKSDVYSFGIVLLEIISGRPPYPAELPDGSLRTVLDWMRSTVETDTFVIVDSFLQEKYRPESMRIVIELAEKCVNQRGINRPDMSKVVQDLLLARTLESGHSQTDTNRMDSSFDPSSSATSPSPQEFTPSAAHMSVDQSYNEGR